MEASALQAPAGLTRTRISIGASLLRLRSDEQLVAVFRAGNDEAFRVIHDRYRQRLFAYTRQMLPGRQDAEDALQDIFLRAYAALRSSDRRLALRPWLYRVAHNRCIDELRRPLPPPSEVLALVRPPEHDPIVEAERRESLRRLIADVRRLPPQQRSALLMRELGGMPYAELAPALGVSVSAVKSLLVRARLGLAQAIEARDTECCEIQRALILAHDRGVRASGVARRHVRDCSACRVFGGQMRGISRQFTALAPLGPLALIANLLGSGGGAASGAAGGGAAGGAASGGVAAGGLAGSSGVFASVGAVAGGASHVALLAAAVVTAGGAVELQRSVSSAPHRPVAHAATMTPSPSRGPSPPGAPGPGASSTPPPGQPPAGQPAPAATRKPSATKAALAPPAPAVPTLAGPGATAGPSDASGSPTATAPVCDSSQPPADAQSPPADGAPFTCSPGGTAPLSGSTASPGSSVAQGSANPGAPTAKLSAAGGPTGAQPTGQPVGPTPGGPPPGDQKRGGRLPTGSDLLPGTF